MTHEIKLYGPIGALLLTASVAFCGGYGDGKEIVDAVTLDGQDGAYYRNGANITNPPAAWTDDLGATNIAAGASDSYTVGTRTLTWNTNAAAGGGGTTYTAGTNLDLNGTEFSLDLAAQASDDLADSAIQAEVDPDSLHLTGDNRMTGDAHIGSNNVDEVRQAGFVAVDYTASGTGLNPDIDGTDFFEHGASGGSNAYESADGVYWLFYISGSGWWAIGDSAGDATPWWANTGGTIDGTGYIAVTATGTVTIAAAGIAAQTVTAREAAMLTGDSWMRATNGIILHGEGDTPADLPVGGWIVHWTNSLTDGTTGLVVRVKQSGGWTNALDITEP